MKSGLTIQELAAEILRQKDSKEDYIVNTHRLQMEPSGSDVVLRIRVVEILEVAEGYACFETMNTVYQVLMDPIPSEAAAPQALRMCA